MTAATILIIDHGKAPRDALESTLRREGYDVVQAPSAEEALKMLTERTADCLLVDPTQPGLGEREVRGGIEEGPDELLRENGELDTFTYCLSHDLRTPLRAIDGFSRALLDDYGPGLDERGQRYLGRIRAGAQRMGQLIDDLLQLSRASRSALATQATDLSGLVRTVVAELRRHEPERQVELAIADGVTAWADSRLIRVVLENLLGNAWKFTARTAAARVEFGCREQDGRPVYFVQDNGAGFDMTFATNLFAPFSRLHSEAEFPGTGIGLAIVHRIVDRHGGRAWAEGIVGRGATISFTLPGPPSSRQGPS